MPRGWQSLLVAALLLVFLFLGWRGRTPTSIFGGDELAYLSLSHSLDHGSYREIWRASAPPEGKYPPAYPAWLMVLRHTVGESHDRLRLANLTLVALALLLMFAIARRLAGPGIALTLLGLLVLNRELLSSGASLMSEGPFLFLTTAALALTIASGSSERWKGFAVVAIGLLAFLTRSAGITLLLGLGVWLWSRRRRGELWAYGIGSVLVVGGWVAWVFLAPRSLLGAGYAGELSAGITPGHDGMIMRVAQRAWSAAIAYKSELPTMLSLPSVSGTRVDTIAWLAVLAVLLSAGGLVLWRAWRVGSVYLLLYAALLLLWPWPDVRILLPVIPLLMLALLLGAWRMVGWLRPPARVPVLALLVALLGFGALKGALALQSQYRDCNRADPYLSAGCYDEATRNLAAASFYVRDHAAAADILMAGKAPSVSFLSGRRTEPVDLIQGLPSAGVPAVLREHQIRFIVLAGIQNSERGPLARALLDSCREFQIEASFPPHALVLKHLAPGETSAGACPVLADWIQAHPFTARH